MCVGKYFFALLTTHDEESKFKTVLKILVTKASINNRARHTEVVGLLRDRKYACVTEYIVRKMNKKHIYFFHEHSHEKTKQTYKYFQLRLITVRYPQCL
jgi:hypothetical protein